MIFNRVILIVCGVSLFGSLLLVARGVGLTWSSIGLCFLFLAALSAGIMFFLLPILIYGELRRARKELVAIRQGRA